MDEQIANYGLLDLMPSPCFCAKNHTIVKVNNGAAKLFLEPGIDVCSLLFTGKEEYPQFTDGCLYLQLNIGGKNVGATVSRMDDCDIFVIEQERELAELQVLSLAAQELRQPLERMMINTDRLISTNVAKTNPEALEYSARLNRALAQMLRLIGNMSDAANYRSRMEVCDIPQLFREIFEKAQTLTNSAGIVLSWSCPDSCIYSIADAQELERCVLNLLSNAIKYTAKNSTILASLTQQGKMLYLRVQDEGEGIPEAIRSSIFQRFLRQPGIEDSRYGIGLGMVLVRSAAAHHGGTVLIDQPNGHGTRVTITLPIRQNTTDFHSPIMRMDYAGGMDHALIELSESLPSELFK